MGLGIYLVGDLGLSHRFLYHAGSSAEILELRLPFASSMAERDIAPQTSTFNRQLN
jgi:hypothetical protein